MKGKEPKSLFKTINLNPNILKIDLKKLNLKILKNQFILNIYLKYYDEIPIFIKHNGKEYNFLKSKYKVMKDVYLKNKEKVLNKDDSSDIITLKNLIQMYKVNEEVNIKYFLTLNNKEKIQFIEYICKNNIKKSITYCHQIWLIYSIVSIDIDEIDYYIKKKLQDLIKIFIDYKLKYKTVIKVNLKNYCYTDFILFCLFNILIKIN